MATFNEPACVITKAVESMSNQDYPQLEIVIADDSTDPDTIDAINRLAAADQRIRVVRAERRMGFVTALNQAMRVANGDLIARMDGDDMSLPDRISKQVAYAQAHPDVDVFGGAMYIVNEDDEIVSERNYPTSESDIMRMFLFRSPFAHPTIMFRRRIIDSGIFYDPQYKKAEDIDFYMRVLKSGSHFGNLQDKLLKYRVSGNLGAKRTRDQWVYNHRARKKMIWRRPVFTVFSYLVSLAYIYVPSKAVRLFYKRENNKLNKS
jgi:glycosyltransferase involved in cell wall biosynthesis